MMHGNIKHTVDRRNPKKYQTTTEKMYKNPVNNGKNLPTSTG